MTTFFSMYGTGTVDIHMEKQNETSSLLHSIYQNKLWVDYRINAKIEIIQLLEDNISKNNFMIMEQGMISSIGHKKY